MPDAITNSDPIAPLRTALAGRYEIERELGSGAFATVYLANDLRHDRCVAIKVLRVDGSSEIPELRFLREIRLLARLQHPNILPLHDSGHVLDLLYYVMPYVAGESLRDRLQRERRMEVSLVARIGRELADALGHAHRAGVIHRDIKPENILLSGAHPIIADFGIAHVVGGVRARQLTRTGFGSPGTPAYMSPEQMLGGSEVDARTDIYSLGCVLYEMLAGAAPFAGASGFTQRFTGPPPSVATVRRDVPPHIDAAIRTAMARLPEERFGTAEALIEALSAPPRAGGAASAAVPGVRYEPPSRVASGDPAPVFDAQQGEAAMHAEAATPLDAAAIAHSPGGALRRAARSIPRVMKRRWWAALGILGLAVLAVLLGPFRGGAVVGADPASTSYVVLPLVARDAIPAAAMDGRRAGLLLHDGLSRWRELRLVGTLLVNDAIARRGEPPRTLDQALEMAGGFGAGLLVWGELTSTGDSLEVRAALYDVRARIPRREARLTIAANASDLRRRVVALSDSLLSIRGGSPAMEGASSGTRSLAAWRAYESAHQAMSEWDVDRAERELRVATRQDPDFPQAHLWLAQLMMWSGAAATDGAAWRDAVSRAHAGGALLSESDAELAAGMNSLMRGRHPEACAAARRLLSRDSLDFSGWFLLGECNRLDATVLPTPGPSGWGFRGSYHTASAAYRRAFELVPSYHLALRDRALAPLQRVLFVDVNRYRAGVTADGTMNFAARPSLSGDTIAFVPFPVAEIEQGTVRALPPRHAQALARNRVVLREVAERWVRAFPQSAAARGLYANALEVEGRVEGDRDAALAEFRHARRLSRTAPEQIGLAVAEVRQLIRLGEHSSAQRLADSLAEQASTLAPAERLQLEGVLALTGRVRQLVALRRESSEQITARDAPATTLRIPLPLAREVAALTAYAAIGAPEDSIRVLRQRVARLFEVHVPPASRQELSLALLARPMSLSYPVLGATALTGLEGAEGQLLRLQRAVAANDHAEYRRRQAALAAARRTMTPGAITTDVAFQEGALLAIAGDTAGAMRRIDDMLGGLLGAPSSMLSDATQAAGVVRAMALRADLAWATGDMAAARQRARAVGILWVNADEELAPVLRRMQAYLAQ